MKNKFINLLSQEPNFSLKIGAVILLVIFSLFLYKVMGLERAEIAKLCQDKATAQELQKQIPVLEEKIKALEVEKRAAGALKRNVTLVLKGIFTKDGVSTALINNDIYQKNDMISGLMITGITSNTVTLEDPFTSEKSKLQLPE
jgi:hypothetical protein